MTLGTRAYDNLQAFCQTIADRIETNASELGDVKVVIIRDQDPGKIADNAKELPMVCVIPMGETEMKMQFSMGSDDFQTDLTVFVSGYYMLAVNNKVPFSDADTMRQYALGIVELFRGNDSNGNPKYAFNNGAIYSARINVAPYETLDRVLDHFQIRFAVKMIA